MGRRSLADHLFEPYSDEEPGSDTWLVRNDFQRIKPSSKFYDNLYRIRALAEDGELIQYSAYMTREKRAAKTIRDLVQHYEGLVTVFRGELAEQ